jgi:hypothetical protein
MLCKCAAENRIEGSVVTSTLGEAEHRRSRKKRIAKRAHEGVSPARCTYGLIGQRAGVALGWRWCRQKLNLDCLGSIRRMVYMPETECADCDMG